MHNKTRFRVATMGLLFLLGVSSTSALELQRGKLKVAINDRTGRFVVWGAEDQNKPVWTPLFLADDPTTSKWKLQVGDKTVVLGDDSGYVASAESTPSGAKVTWTSKTLVASLAFDFVLSASSTVADGLKLSLSVVNVSENSLKVGVRWVLDTNLGEKKDHFRLSSGETVVSESRIEGNFPESWISRGVSEDQPGLLMMVGKGGTTPSRVYFANWKRVDDTVWDYVYKSGRDFNLLPYSFNDSAMVNYYDTQDLASGASRDVVAIFGLSSAGTFVGSRVASANPIDDLLKKNPSSSQSALDQDLVSLETLGHQIDAKLADTSKVTSEDLKLLQAVLDQIDERRKALEAAKP